MIAALVVAAAALGLLAWVVAPLREGRRDDGPGPGAELDEATARKQAALVAIVDLENERAVGKLSDTDFEILRADYERRALTALREVDALRDSSVDEDELELEIAAVRERLRCPNCGAARSPGEACERCGA